MSDDNIRKYIEAWSNYKLPGNIDTPNTMVYFFHGTKSNEMVKELDKILA